MKNKLIQIKHLINVSKHNFNMHWNKLGYKYFIIIFSGLIIYSKDIHFVLQLQNNHSNLFNYEQSTSNEVHSRGENIKSISGINSEKREFNLISFNPSTPKEKRYKNYIINYHKLAIKEMQKNKIPASITLAQGLLETNGGLSKLATDNNNHFGIKCFSKKCKKGHCSNFNDDSHKDFFRKYNSKKESYKDHSILLKKDRYKKLFSFNKNDYKSWAFELKKAGYATDKKYPEKLIEIIEKYNLHLYDN
ncbi:MAG: flagellum-specific peptidoglycan hydrolase FlgJ [Maribacter sp.]|jgi:flagellum-specific peptidoglycan hydrolase FlgJ